MGAWILDLVLISLAILLMAFALYKLMFSATEETRRELSLRPRPRFERREPELKDRRKLQLALPEGVVDRRQGARR